MGTLRPQRLRACGFAWQFFVGDEWALQSTINADRPSWLAVSCKPLSVNNLPELLEKPPRHAAIVP